MSDSGVVAGRVASVNIILRYMNRGMQDAFGTTLSFNQQEAVFSQYLLRDNVSCHVLLFDEPLCWLSTHLLFVDVILKIVMSY